MLVYQGKILIGGTKTPGGYQMVVRYNADGSLDNSFDGDGITTNNVLQEVSGLAIQNDGRILVAGTISRPVTSHDFVVARLEPNGSLDTTYGVGGYALMAVTHGVEKSPAIALDGAGRAVLAGTSEGLFGVARLLGDAVPRLEIARLAGNVEISWPSAAIGFLLQSTPGLSGGGTTWTDVANSRTTNRIVVSNPANAGYYRLKL